MGLSMSNRNNTGFVFYKVFFYVLLLIVLVFIRDVFDLLGFEVSDIGVVVVQLAVVILLVVSLVLKFRNLLGKVKERKGEGSDRIGGDISTSYGQSDSRIRELDKKFDQGLISEEEYLERLKKIKKER